MKIQTLLIFALFLMSLVVPTFASQIESDALYDDDSLLSSDNNMEQELRSHTNIVDRDLETLDRVEDFDDVETLVKAEN